MTRAPLDNPSGASGRRMARYVGGAFLAYVLVQGWQVCRGLSWPTVEAQVLDSRMVAVREPDVDLNGDRLVHRPRVRYRYQVDGQVFTGDRLGPFANGSILKGLHPGSRVTVHYDPQDPASAVLAPATHVWPLGLLSLLGGGVFWLGMRRDG